MRIVNFLGVNGCALARPRGPGPCAGSYRDELECYNWAKQQSGFDPMAAPQATAPPTQQQSSGGGALGGAAPGAAIGAVGGAIAGNAGKGAAI